MSEDRHQQWLIDRADHLRSTCASSAGILVTANAVAISAVTFLTSSVWDAVTTASDTSSHLLAQLSVLAWIALGVSFSCSVAAERSVISYHQVAFLEVETKHQIPISPDGEQLVSAGFRVEAPKQRLPLVLPEETA